MRKTTGAVMFAAALLIALAIAQDETPRKPLTFDLDCAGGDCPLDFGLARRLADLGRADDATLDIARPQLTAPGTILGTPDLHVAGTSKRFAARCTFGSVFLRCSSG